MFYNNNETAIDSLLTVSTGQHNARTIKNKVIQKRRINSELVEKDMKL